MQTTKNAVLAWLLCLSTCILWCQNPGQLGVLPSINLNKKLPKDWSLNVKGESRQVVYREGFNSQYQLSDVSLAAAKRTGLQSNLAFGYLARLRSAAPLHRIFQQVTLVNGYTGYRLAHRFGADQNFSTQENTVYRLRYRLAGEFALQGLELDPKELFLKAQNEYLAIWQSPTFTPELRLGAFVGYTLSRKQKLELGLDYRCSNWLNSPAQHRYWLALSLYQSF